MSARVVGARLRRAVGDAPGWIGYGALLVAVLAPIAAAVVWAVQDHWYPVGDNAYFSLRPRDVLTTHHPWLGTWTSASQSTGIDLNNPGPLLFDVLAVPAKLHPVLGPMVGTALLAAACAVAAVLAGSKAAGTTGAVVVAVAVAALTWSMGSALVVDPWQPHSLLLPFLLFVVLVWATVAGRGYALAGAVGVGSLLLQTHLPYVVLVPGLLLLGIVALAVAARRDPESARRWRGWMGAALVVGALAWAQPVVEQLAGPGEGNLSRLARASTRGEEPAVGPVGSARVLGAVVAPWPGWGRSDFAEALQPVPSEAGDDSAVSRLEGVPSTAGAAVSLAVLLGVLVLAGVTSRRRGDAPWAAAALVLGAAIAAGFVTIAMLPVTSYGLAVHQVRWLWPLGVLTTVVGAAALVGRRGARVVHGVAVVGLVVLTGAAMSRHRHPVGPTADDDAAPVLRALASQLAGVEVAGPLLLEEDVLRVFEPYSIGIVMELDRRGVEVVVDDEGLVRQLGEDRRATGDEAGRLLVLQGPEWEVPTGARVIAEVEGLDPGDARSEADLRARVRAAAELGRVALTDIGVDVRDAGELDWLEVGSDGTLDPALLEAPGVVAEAVVRGYLAAPGRDGDALRRWAVLARQRDRATVTVAVAPVTTTAR